MTTITAPVASCSGIEITNIESFAVPEAEPAKEAETDSVRLELTPVSSVGAGTVVADGPIFGSMDARELATRVTCVEGRLTLTATITRSADYAGAIEKNVLWHPRILLSAIFHQASAEVESVWRLRLTNGQELSSGQTPPYQGAPYPRSLRRSFSRPLAPAKQTP